jgi:sugar O-acyltransferase (sialic acid O-acetyltransferase NeuD family)
MSPTKRPLIIVGYGGHGRVVADIARSLDQPPDWFLDDNPTAAGADDVIGGPIRSQIPRHIATHRYVVAIGEPAIRREFSEMILSAGGELATLVHPTAVIAPDVTIGAGTVIMAGSIVNTGTRIGRFAVVNTGAIVDHDNFVEDNVHISPGCCLAGRVTCRRDSFIGTGASIIPRMVIGEGAVVAAGSTVIKPVRAHTLVAGCPAIEKKNLRL